MTIKKWLAVLLALVMALSLVACGKQTNEKNTDSSDSQQTQTGDTQGTDTQSTDSSKNNTTEGSENAASADSESGTASGKTTGDTTGKSDSDSGSTDSGDDSGEAESLSMGVTESGDDIIVTAENDTSVGKATCTMTYAYNGKTLKSITAKYILPDKITAGELADELKAQEDVEPSSVKVSDKTVTCSLSDDVLAEFQQLSRSEVLTALQYAAEDSE